MATCFDDTNLNTLDVLLLKTASLLDANLPSPQSIQEVLKEVGTVFNLNGGFVYEPNRHNVFELQEAYNKTSFPLCPSFHLDSFNPQQNQQLCFGKIIYIHKNDSNTLSELGFLSVFHAHTLVLLPIVDANNTLIGLVGLLDSIVDAVLLERELSTIQKILRAVSAHIANRVYQRKIEYSRLTLESILDNTGIDIYVNDFENHDILYVNKSMAAPYGGMHYFAGKKCFEALYNNRQEPCTYCPQKRLIDKKGNPTKVYSWDYQRPFDGSWFRVFSTAFQWMDGRLAHIVSSVDITENKRNEYIIKRMANYDSLTKLPNRRKLLADCNLRFGSPHAGNGYLLFLDLDGFKAINDTLGHQAGDSLLRMIGDFFEENESTNGNSYRYGCDEFVMLFDNISKKEVTRILKKILKRFAQPWKVNAQDVLCEASIGIAQYPEDGNTADQLLAVADATMYMVKRSGKGAACFAGDTQYIKL